MDCDAARLLLHGHLDGELDLVSDLEVERHLEQCARCAREYAAMRAMRARLKDESLGFEAPSELRQRIRRLTHAALPESEASPSRMRYFPPRAIEFAIPLAIAAMLALYIVPRAVRPGRSEILARELVASHVRSLMAAHLTDVSSTDQHTVKPWFNGKLDFSPPVTDFAKDGFPLVGGRLDYVDNQPVAALVYLHGKHVINVFLWPLAGDTTSAERIETDQGYNVEQMIVARMNCWIVSDLNRQELGKLAELLRTRG